MKRKRSKEQRERDRVRSKNRYLENKHIPEFLERIKRNTREWQIRWPAKYMLSQARVRARNKKIPFKLKWTDIVIPEFCPILGIPLKFGDGCAEACSPSLDRIIPESGYIKGNIQVISLKANLMKSNATPKELHTFANWILKNISLDKFII